MSWLSKNVLRPIGDIITAPMKLVATAVQLPGALLGGLTGGGGQGGTDIFGGLLGGLLGGGKGEVAVPTVISVPGAAAAPADAVSTGLSTQTMLLIGGGVLAAVALVVMMRRR